MTGESRFEVAVIKRLELMFPGAIVLKNYPNYRQGFPDRLILFRDRWAAFEMKAAPNSDHQPNQDYYIDRLNRMSYASFIYPENEEVVLYGLQQALRTRRSTRVFER